MSPSTTSTTSSTNTTSRPTAADVLAALDRINNQLDRCVRLLAASPEAIDQRPPQKAHAMNAHEHLLQAAAELQRDPETGNWPGTHPSPSQKKMNRPDLEQEVSISWVMPEAEGRQLPWLRERFMATRPKRSDLIAYSTDSRGRCIRCWLSRPEDQHAYQRLVSLGAGTAPLEAVHPPSIKVGRPAIPAHPFLLPLMWANIAAAEGAPVVLPVASSDDVANAEEVMQSFWQGLAPDRPPLA